MSVELTLCGTGLNSYIEVSFGTKIKVSYIIVKKLFRVCNSNDLAFKSLAHRVEDEGVDCGVNIAHRMTNNLIKSYLVSVSILFGGL